MPLDPNIIKAAIVIFVFGIGLLILTCAVEFFVPLLLIAVIAVIAYFVFIHRG